MWSSPPYIRNSSVSKTKKPPEACRHSGEKKLTKNHISFISFFFMFLWFKFCLHFWRVLKQGFKEVEELSPFCM